MIVVLNLIIIFGMCYFCSLGLKTAIHNRQAKKEARIEAKRREREDAAARRRGRRRPAYQQPEKTVDRGYLIGHRIDK